MFYWYLNILRRSFPLICLRAYILCWLSVYPQAIVHINKYLWRSSYRLSHPLRMTYGINISTWNHIYLLADRVKSCFLYNLLTKTHISMATTLFFETTNRQSWYHNVLFSFLNRLRCCIMSWNDASNLDLCSFVGEINLFT